VTEFKAIFLPTQPVTRKITRFGRHVVGRVLERVIFKKSGISPFFDGSEPPRFHPPRQSGLERTRRRSSLRKTATNNCQMLPESIGADASHQARGPTNYDTLGLRLATHSSKSVQTGAVRARCDTVGCVHGILASDRRGCRPCVEIETRLRMSFDVTVRSLEFPLNVNFFLILNTLWQFKFITCHWKYRLLVIETTSIAKATMRRPE
jgi:hypothetical protein